MDLDTYLGRVVRLRKYAFREMARMNVRRGVGLENCFVVAKADSALRELTCYGENIRITVSADDVVVL